MATPFSNSPVISYTISGDTEVNLTGQDDWGRDWEKTELERSLEGMHEPYLSPTSSNLFDLSPALPKPILRAGQLAE